MGRNSFGLMLLLALSLALFALERPFFPFVDAVSMRWAVVETMRGGMIKS